jgi:hypothetical protein
MLALAARAEACPFPEGRLTFRQMIVQGRTGEAPFRYLLLGRVISIRDLGGDPGGRMMAKVAVAAHPLGFAPLISRVRFERPAPGDEGYGYIHIRRGDRYAMVAKKLRDGSFTIVSICGPTHELSRHRFAALVRLSHR